MQNDLNNWLNTLLDLRRNLIPFLSEEECKKIEEKLNSLPDKFNSSSKIKPQFFGKVSKTLDEIYIILYCCMKTKGLLLPKAIDSSKAIIEM